MRTIIAGTRTSTRADFEAALSSCPWASNITSVVCGMASGADSHGAHWAHDNGIEVKEFHAQWKRFGRSAGPRRNQHMADNADALIAVWDGQSHGTKNMIDIARSRGLMVHVWHIESKLTYSTPSQAELFK